MFRSASFIQVRPKARLFQLTAFPPYLCLEVSHWNDPIFHGFEVPSSIDLYYLQSTKISAIGYKRALIISIIDLLFSFVCFGLSFIVFILNGGKFLRRLCVCDVR